MTTDDEVDMINDETLGVCNFQKQLWLRNSTYTSALCVMFRLSSYGVLVEYGCEKKITQFSNLSASIAVSVPSGVTLKLRLLYTILIILSIFMDFYQLCFGKMSAEVMV